jgi:hypothetical protein
VPWPSSWTPAAKYVGKCMGRGFWPADYLAMLGPMSTLLWLTAVAVSTAIVWATTALLVSASMFSLPTDATPTQPQTFTISPACDTEDNWPLVYARTTGRIPANYCPVAR